MKVTILKPVEVDIDRVRVLLPVRYGTEDIPADFPLRKGDTWSAEINMDDGSIIGWPEGKAGELYMKVVDEGAYWLLDAAGNAIYGIADYVPHAFIPGEYGDYVHLIINDEGRVTNWKPNKADIQTLIEDYKP